MLVGKAGDSDSWEFLFEGKIIVSLLVNEGAQKEVCQVEWWEKCTRRSDP